MEENDTMNIDDEENPEQGGSTSGFEKPKNSQRYSRKSGTKRGFDTLISEKNNTIPINNRFEDLNNDEGNARAPSQEAKKYRGEENQTPKKQKIPPIVITSKITNHATFIQTLKGLAQDKNVKTAYTRDGFKIFLNSKHIFGTVKTGLDEMMGVTYYTHLLKDEKPKHAVLYGLPRIECTEIQADLNNQGFKTERCVIMKTKEKVETYPPIYLITFGRESTCLKPRS